MHFCNSHLKFTAFCAYIVNKMKFPEVRDPSPQNEIPCEKLN